LKYVVNQEKVNTYLTDRNLADKCTLCGTGKLELLTDTIYGVYDFPFSEFGDGEYAALLLLPLICKHCGNTHLINAFQQDLLEPCEGGSQNEA